MSEQKKISVGAALLAFGIGGAFAGACMAGLAYLMVRHGLSQAAAWPMASAAVCAAACSAVAGCIFSAQPWAGLWSHPGGNVRTAPDRVWSLCRFAPAEMQLVRFALVFLFGCLGGIFGMLRTERRHH